MDNLEQLGAMLTPLLSDPETMNSLRQAAEQMGLGGLLPDGEEIHKPETVSHKPEDPPQLPLSGLSPELLSTVGRLMPLLSAPKEDNTTRLLDALRPFLSQPRAKRLDEAERLLSLTRVLSILKESKLM